MNGLKLFVKGKRRNRRLLLHAGRCRNEVHILFRRLPLRLTFALASRAALIDLLLERAECLISRPANGAYKNSAVLDHCVEVFAHKTVLEFHERDWIGKPEEFLRRAQISTHHALNETVHPLLPVLQTAPCGEASAPSAAGL